jgi:general stress protein 26
MDQDQRRKILAVLQRSQFGVISTNTGGKSPESAVVAISETEDLDIIFGSFNTARKNKNIRENSFVSVVVGWDMEHKKTVQIEGEAFITTGEEREMLENIHCAKNKGSSKYRGDSKQEYFRIKPFWIRYSDFSVHPQEVWEVSV